MKKNIRRNYDAATIDHSTNMADDMRSSNYVYYYTCVYIIE